MKRSRFAAERIILFMKKIEDVDLTFDIFGKVNTRMEL